MTARRRIREIMAEAGLAGDQLERERLRGQQESEQTGRTMDALTRLADTGVSAGFRGLDVYKQGVDEDAATAAKKLVAENAGAVGDELDGPPNPLTGEGGGYKQSAGEVAKAKAGPLDAIEGGDMFGFRKKAAAKASADAETQLASNVTANRDKAKAGNVANAKRAADAEAQALQNKAAQQSIDTGAANEQRANDTAARTTSKTKAEEAAALAIGKGTSLGQFIVDNVDSGIDEATLGRAYLDRADAEAKGAADLDLKGAQAAAKERGGAAGTGSSDKKKKAAQEDSDDLRNKFAALPQTKAFNEVKVTFGKMQRAAKDESAAGDMSVIYSFMKMQDPGSTVREGEFASAQNAGGVSDKLRNQYNKIVNGERLSPAQRADFLKQAQGFLEEQKSAYDEQANFYTDIAKRRGADVADIIPGAPSAESEKPPWRR